MHTIWSIAFCSSRPPTASIVTHPMIGLIVALCLVFGSPIAAKALSFEFGPDDPVHGWPTLLAIRDLEVDGDMFDVSFDGSFGASLFIGDQIRASAVYQATLSAVNQAEFFHPTAGIPVFIDYDAKQILQVLFSSTEAYQSFRAAGWVDDGVRPFDPAVRIVQFLSVPEPTTFVHLASVALGLAWIRRRRMG